MHNTTKVLASIASAVVPVGAGYWTAATHLHDKLVGWQGADSYRSLESTLRDARVAVPSPEQVSLVGAMVITLGLLYVANEVAKPVTRGFAHLYGARLEK